MKLIEYIMESTTPGDGVSKALKEQGAYELPSYNLPLWRTIKNELEWDKISVDDIEFRTSEEQRANSYKRAGKDEYVLWYAEVDGRMVPANRSIGLTVVGNGTNPTVKSVSKKTAMAVVITDYTRFSTTELRRRRREIADNVNRYKEDRGIVEQYIEVWKNFVESRSHNFDTNSDVIAKSDSVMDKYLDILSEVRANEFWMRNYNEVHEMIKEIEKLFKRICDTIESKGSIRDLDFSKKFMNVYNDMKDAVMSLENMIKLH